MEHRKIIETNLSQASGSETSMLPLHEQGWQNPSKKNALIMICLNFY